MAKGQNQRQCKASSLTKNADAAIYHLGLKLDPASYTWASYEERVATLATYVRHAALV